MSYLGNIDDIESEDEEQSSDNSDTEFANIAQIESEDFGNINKFTNFQGMYDINKKKIFLNLLKR